MSGASRFVSDRVPLGVGSITGRYLLLGWAPLAISPPSSLVPAVTPTTLDRLVGLVVKASASRAEGRGFESRLRRDFSGVESYQ